MANQVDFKILPSDQFNVYSPQTRSDKIITYFTLLSKLRGDILAVGQEDDPNDIVSAYYSNVGGTQTLHLVKADGSEVIASQPEQVISGTLNYVSKFTSANDIGDSQIFDDGTNVGIGTTSMTHKLELGTGGVFADYFQLDTTYSNGFVIGAISWDSDNGTADVGLSGSLKLKIGQDDVWYVKNQTGSPINKGTAVYANGTLGASGRITIAPMIADGTIPARFFLGIVAETIANGADGYVLNKGKLRQINTNAYNEGDVLWVSPTTAGALTSTEPTAPNLKLPVAFVVYKASNGILAVRATTGQRIADASDVDYTGAPDNSFLVYNSATGVWEDEAVGIFKTIAVSGQSDVVADTYTDTLTLVAGTNVTITTDASTDSITINSTDQFVGTVTSVDMSVPTGFAISGNPITTSGTLALAFASGYSLPTNASQANWDTAYNNSVTAFSYNTSTGVLTLTQQDAGTLTATITLSPFDTDNLTEGATNKYDKTVALTGAGTTTITGTYPSFTITSNDEFDGTVTSVATTAPITGGTITTSGTIGITQSGAASDGYLSSTDWNAFNGKQDAITLTTTGTSGVATLIGATLNIPDYTEQYSGTVTSVSTTAPITGGTITTTGTIGITQAGAASDGYLSSADWTTFNSKQGALTFTAPLVNTSGTITITQSGAATDGYLSSTDWNTFNDKEPALTKGNLTEVTSAVLTITNGTNAVIGSGTSIQVTQSSSTTNGYLSSTDWSTFNGKASNSFTTIAVATQSSIVADTATDTLTVAAGSGVTITTDAITDTLTISATGSGGTVTSVDLTAGTGISVSGGPITTSGSITVTNTAPDQVVVLTASTGISTSGTYPNFTITNSAPDQVVSLTGAGTTSISGTYPNFTITSDDQYDGTVTSVDLTAGTGISVSGGPITSSGSITVTNNDRGSSQNIFKNINVITSQDWDDSDFVWNTDDGSWSSGIDQSSIVADSNNDTLYIESVGGISITTDATTDTIYFDNIDKGSEQNIFKNIVVGSDTITADSNDDTITFAAGTGISVSANVSTDTLTITNNDKGSTQNIFKNIAVSGQSTIVADSNDDTLTVVAGTGISITTSAATDTLTITNTGTPSLALANSINYVPASSAFWYPVTVSYATIVMDTTNRARLAAPVSVSDVNRILATVTLEVANTGSAGFCTIGIQLYNNTDAVPVAKSLHTWTAYLDANLQDSSYTLFTLHFPIDDLDVDYGDDIDVQVISIASTQEIMAFRYSLVAVTAA